MKRVRFVAQAREEYLAQTGRYVAEQHELGVRFVAAVESAAARAVAFPLSGSPGPAGTRRIVIRGFPFWLVYRPHRSGITIFAVAHFARDPGYWRTRVQEP